MYLTSNQPGQGQLLNQVPILTSVGQGPSNGAMNQRIVAVGGNQSPTREFPVKLEPVESEPDEKTDGSGETSFNSNSAHELDNDAATNDDETQLTKSEQIVVKQEQFGGNIE